MSKHSPAPWRGPYRSIDQKLVIIRPDDVIIAYLDNWTDDADEQSANARLIAAAPDLLAALAELTQAVEDEGVPCMGLLIAKCRAAIARATATEEA